MDSTIFCNILNRYAATIFVLVNGFENTSQNHFIA